MTVRPVLTVLALAAAIGLPACASPPAGTSPAAGTSAAASGTSAAASAATSSPSPERTDPMQLGNFSVCLLVKDLATSRAFYEKLGFVQVSGDAAQGWIVLKNGPARLGLFQGFIERTTLTFNPGWSPDAQPLADFTDVRDLQRLAQERGLKLDVTADPSGTGPGFFILHDPDGNPIFVDQHVPRPAR